MLSKHLSIVFSIILLTTALLLGQDKATKKIYISWFEAINMNKGFSESTTRLFKNYVNDEGKFEAVISERMDSIPLTQEEIKRKAQSKGAEFFTMAEMNRIGERVIVSLFMYKTQDGSKIWSDKLKADTPEYLDPIIQRLARNLGTEIKGTNDNDIYSVTSNESKELATITSHNYFGITIGGAVGINFKRKGMLTGLGMLYSYDTRDFIYDMKGSFHFNHYDRSIWSLSIEVFKPLNQLQKKTWYAGGGVAWVGVGVPVKEKYQVYSYYSSPTYEERTISDITGGLMLLAGGGYVFNRNSDVVLR